MKFFLDQGEKYKAEIIGSIPQDEEVTVYHEGKFSDLCRGPHVPSTGKLKVLLTPNATRRIKTVGNFQRPAFFRRLKSLLTHWSSVILFIVPSGNLSLLFVWKILKWLLN